jgi:hypothetical protein
MKQKMTEEEKVIRRSKCSVLRQNGHLKLAKNQSNPATATAVILDRGINAQIGNVVSLDGSVNVNLHLNNIIRANCDMSVNINDIVVLKDNLDCDMDVTLMDMVGSEGDVDVTDSSVDAMDVVDTCCYEDGHDSTIEDPLADEDPNLSYKPFSMYAQSLEITDDVISAAQQLLKIQHSNSSRFGTSIRSRDHPSGTSIRSRDHPSGTSIRRGDHPSGTSIRSRDHPNDTSIPIGEEGRYTIYQLCGANEVDPHYRNRNISPLAQGRLSNVFNDSNDSDSY